MPHRLFSQNRRERWYQLVLERLALLRKADLETIAKQNSENHKQQLLIDDLKAELENLKAENHKQQLLIDDLTAEVENLKAENHKQQILIDDLKAKSDINSRNSSKPPSLDQKPNSPSSPKPSPKSLRSKSGKKRGGQKGHKGHGFVLPKRSPDTIISCLPPECLQCQHSSECEKTQKKTDTRYVLDLVLKLLLIRYDAYRRQCPLRDGKILSGTFPVNVSHTKQYGDTFRALAVAMYLFFNCSYQKVHEFLSGLTGTQTSVGWSCNKLKALAEGKTAQEAIEKIKSMLLQEHMVSCDETGARAEAKNAWVHTASTPRLTYQTASQSRGVKGMIEGDFLPHFQGTIVHDCWTPYWSEKLFADTLENEEASNSLTHALCNQHLMRELRWVYEHGPGHENGNQNWAFDLAAWLSTFNKYRQKVITRGQRSLTDGTIENLREVFMDCLDEGWACNPKTDDQKDSHILRKTHALLTRLEKRTTEYLRFLTDFLVPFTSNQAERDLRGHKPRFAVSGCFRTFEGLQRYIRLYSIGQTARKNNVSWIDMILGLIRQQVPEVIMGLIPKKPNNDFCPTP